MKYYITLMYLTTTLYFGSAAYAQQVKQFIINGTIKNCCDSISSVYFIYENNGQIVVDSATVNKGRYQLNGNLQIDTSTFAVIFKNNPSIQTYKLLKSVSYPSITSKIKQTSILFIEPGVQRMSHINSFLNIRVKGSKATDEYEIITKKMNEYREKYISLIDQYSQSVRDNDASLATKLSNELKINDSIRNENVYRKYLIENAHSPIALYVLQKYINNHVSDYSKIESLFNGLPDLQRNSTIGKRIESKIQADKGKTIGAVAKDFIQNTPFGRPVSLSSFRGKYVLLDFWASWCAPCRLENPYLVAAYEKYKSKGFEILSVSLDNNKGKWMKAIESDSLNWTHVSDLKYWNNRAAQLYNVESVPFNLLIDPNGLIIDRNLRREALEEKLEEIY